MTTSNEMDIQSRVTPILNDEGKAIGSTVKLNADEACIVFSDMYLFIASTSEEATPQVVFNNALAAAFLRRVRDEAWLQELMIWFSEQQEVKDAQAAYERDNPTTVTT